jgi:ATP-dependent Clp protease ATP-binding subunit ClpC
VFERFSERARQVVVLGQDEARRLEHGYIGTEHLLLGLLREEEGLAARVLSSLGVTLGGVRVEVGRIVGQGDAPASGQIPFTPRAKKVLELGFQEATKMGHAHIGTEHILLGLVVEGEGVANRILADLGASPERLRGSLIAALTGQGGFAKPFDEEGVSHQWLSLDRPRSQRLEPVSLAVGAVLLAAGIGLGWLIWG